MLCVVLLHNYAHLLSTNKVTRSVYSDSKLSPKIPMDSVRRRPWYVSPVRLRLCDHPARPTWFDQSTPLGPVLCINVAFQELSDYIMWNGSGLNAIDIIIRATASGHSPSVTRCSASHVVLISASSYIHLGRPSTERTLEDLEVLAEIALTSTCIRDSVIAYFIAPDNIMPVRLINK